MKKIIKALCLLAGAAVTAVMLAGCGSVGADTMPVPENGWSRWDLMSVTYIAGCKLSCPPAYADFKSKTKIREDLIVEGKGFVNKLVYYNDKLITDMTYHCAEKNEDITDESPIDGMYMEMVFSQRDEQICMNGIKMGDSMDSVIEALGEPDKWRKFDTVADYKFTDGGSMTLDFEAGVLFSISFNGLAG